MRNSTVTNCNTLSDGGAVHVTNQSVFQVFDSVFSNNTGYYGGAIATFDGATFYSVRTLYAFNAAVEGGAMRLDADTNNIIDSCVFLQNYAILNASGISAGHIQNLTLTNSEFYGHQRTFYFVIASTQLID